MLRFVALGITLLAVAWAVWPTPPHAPPLRLSDGRFPNILLLTIDTLRADHLGYVESGPNDLTPSLDALTNAGTAFLAASTPAPTTRAATAALLTGAYRGGHGVRGNGWSLGKRSPVLAELLGAAGYRTAAFFGNGILAAEYGFGRGFELYDSFAKFRGRGFSKDEVGVDRARDWLANAPPEPWFLWVHLMDPHGPYDSAPPEAREKVAREDPRPETVLEMSKKNTGLGVIPKYQKIQRTNRASVYRWRYRGEVHHSDAQAGRLLTTLEELGLAGDTLIVLTADHGEGLGDHDYFFQHGWFPFEGSVAIPLAFRLPGRVGAGVKLESPVSLVDVTPTVLGGLGLPIPDSMDGRDLSGALSASRSIPMREGPVFTASTLLSGMSAVRLGRWKLVHTPPPPAQIRPEDPWKSDYATEESFRLYDIDADPGEAADLSAEHPAEQARLRALLAVWESEQNLHIGVDRTPPADVDPRLQDMLRSLGYVD
ncbi:MAG: sulfatase-like hydrolase/transferase [Candidatus Binatia bacterium]|nr:sulfatase-like hydrolase/transferase [Candidatus Binatia bacterium]